MKFKGRIKRLWKELCEEITFFEYILWWIARIMLLCAVIFAKSPQYSLLDCINMLATFTMSLIRFIFPEKSFIGRIDFRVQHLINAFEVLGIFGGHLLDFYSVIPKFDRILHLLSGPAVVVAGYYIYKAFESKKGKDTYKRRLNPQTATYSAVSFSFAVISLWEIQEFFSDYFIGSQNQGYYYAPPEDDIFFRIFGDGAAKGAGQYPLWDTMMDMTDAAVTTVISGIILLTVLIKIKKKYEN